MLRIYLNCSPVCVTGGQFCCCFAFFHAAKTTTTPPIVLAKGFTAFCILDNSQGEGYAKRPTKWPAFRWSLQGMILRLPDYESGALTNVNCTFFLDEEDTATSRTITVLLEGLRPQSTNSPWAIVDESAGLYTYTYSRNGGVGGQMVTLELKTLASNQHSGSYSVTLSADGDNGIPVYREVEFDNSEYEQRIVSTNSGNLSTGNNRSVTSNPVTITFSNIYAIGSQYVRPGRDATITVNAGSGRTICSVEITFITGYTYNYTTTVGESSLEGAVWSWSGESAGSLVITNGYDRSSRISSINVIYK